jgi:hypothetical protein
MRDHAGDGTTGRFQTRPIVTAWMRAFAAGAVACLATGPATGHDWYTGFANPRTGEACCNIDDCKRVPPETVRSVKEGWLLVPTGEVVPYREALRSRDRDFHVCRRGAWRAQSQPGPVVCLFAPPFGF